MAPRAADLISVRSVSTALSLSLVAVTGAIVGSMSITAGSRAVDDTKRAGSAGVDACFRSGEDGLGACFASGRSDVELVSGQLLSKGVDEVAAQFEEFMRLPVQLTEVLLRFFASFEPDTVVDPAWLAANAQPLLAAVLPTALRRGTTQIYISVMPFSARSMMDVATGKQHQWGGTFGVLANYEPNHPQSTSQGTWPYYMRALESRGPEGRLGTNTAEIWGGVMDPYGRIVRRPEQDRNATGLADPCNTDAEMARGKMGEKVFPPGYLEPECVFGIAASAPEQALITQKTLTGAMDGMPELLEAPDVPHWSPIMTLGPKPAAASYAAWSHPNQLNVLCNGAPGCLPAVGGRSGYVMVAQELVELSRMMRRATDGVGFAGSRLYGVQRHPWTGDVGMMTGASHGTDHYARTPDKSSGIVEIKTARPANDSDDAVIRAHAVHALALPRGYASLLTNRTEPWRFAAGGGGDVLYWTRVRDLSDAYGYLWYLTMMIPRDAMMEQMDAARAATQQQVLDDAARVRQRIDADNAAVEEDREQRFWVMLCVVIVCAVVLMALSVVLNTAMTAPLLRLSAQMNAVACMELDDVDTSRVSRLAEVRRMQRSFARMCKNMREFRNYMPQSLTATIGAEEEEPTEVEKSGTKAGTSKRGSRVTASSVSRSRHAASTAASSQSAQMRAFMNKIAGDGLKKKKISIVACNCVGWHARTAGSEAKARDLHQNYVAGLLGAVAQSKGIVDLFSGDRVSSTYNAVHPLGTHKVKAAEAAFASAEAARGCGGAAPLQLSAAAASGDGTVGNTGCDGLKRFTVFSASVAVVHAVERFGRSAGAAGVLAAGGVADDAANTFQLRSLGRVVLPGKADGKGVAVREVTARKQVSEDEWMYQLEEGAKNNPHADWDECADAIAAGDWGAATAALAKLPAEDGTPQALLRAAVEARAPLLTPIAFH